MIKREIFPNMKGNIIMKKIAAFVTAFAAAAAVSVSASAYTIDRDLGFGWSASVTIPGEEFDEVTTDKTVTITYETDPNVMDSYWCIKPMINDEGWPFVDTLVGPTLSDGKDSYTLEVDSSSISFRIPAEELEHIQVAGMAIMGHGITLKEMTVSDDPLPSGGADETPDETPDKTPDEAPSTTPTNPGTGVEGTAGFIAAAALGAVIVARKRK